MINTLLKIRNYKRRSQHFLLLSLSLFLLSCLGDDEVPVNYILPERGVTYTKAEFLPHIEFPNGVPPNLDIRLNGAPISFDAFEPLNDNEIQVSSTNIDEPSFAYQEMMRLLRDGKNVLQVVEPYSDAIVFKADLDGADINIVNVVDNWEGEVAKGPNNTIKVSGYIEDVHEITSIYVQVQGLDPNGVFVDFSDNLSNDLNTGHYITATPGETKTEGSYFLTLLPEDHPPGHFRDLSDVPYGFHFEVPDDDSVDLITIGVNAVDINGSALPPTTKTWLRSDVPAYDRTINTNGGISLAADFYTFESVEGAIEAGMKGLNLLAPNVCNPEGGFTVQGATEIPLLNIVGSLGVVVDFKILSELVFTEPSVELRMNQTINSEEFSSLDLTINSPAYVGEEAPYFPRFRVEVPDIQIPNCPLPFCKIPGFSWDVPISLLSVNNSETFQVILQDFKLLTSSDGLTEVDIGKIEIDIGTIVSSGGEFLTAEIIRDTFGIPDLGDLVDGFIDNLLDAINAPFNSFWAVVSNMLVNGFELTVAEAVVSSIIEGLFVNDLSRAQLVVRFGDETRAPAPTNCAAITQCRVKGGCQPTTVYDPGDYRFGAFLMKLKPEMASFFTLDFDPEDLAAESTAPHVPGPNNDLFYKWGLNIGFYMHGSSVNRVPSLGTPYTPGIIEAAELGACFTESGECTPDNLASRSTTGVAISEMFLNGLFMGMWESGILYFDTHLGEFSNALLDDVTIFFGSHSPWEVELQPLVDNQDGGGMKPDPNAMKIVIPDMRIELTGDLTIPGANLPDGGQDIVFAYVIADVELYVGLAILESQTPNAEDKLNIFLSSAPELEIKTLFSDFGGQLDTSFINSLVSAGVQDLASVAFLEIPAIPIDIGALAGGASTPSGVLNAQLRYAWSDGESLRLLLNIFNQTQLENGIPDMYTKP